MEAWGEVPQSARSGPSDGSVKVLANQKGPGALGEQDDKYLRLKEEHQSLKKLYHEQEIKSKQLATKLVRLTADIKRSETHGHDAANGKGSRARDVETENLIEDLREQIRELKRKNDRLEQKVTYYRNLCAQPGKKGPYAKIKPRTDTGLEHQLGQPGEISRSRPHDIGNADRKRLVPALGRSGAEDSEDEERHTRAQSRPPTAHGKSEGPVDHATEQKLQMTVSFLREKLREAENVIRELSRENESLQQRLASAEQQASQNALSTGVRPQALHDYELSLLRVQQENRGLAAQIASLTTELENAHALVQPLKENQANLLTQNKQLSAELKEERVRLRKMEELQKRVAMLEGALAESEVLIEDLRSQKKSVSEENSKLLSDAFFTERKKETTDKVLTLRHEMDKLKEGEFKHLEDVKVYLNKIDDLTKQNDAIRAEKRDAEVRSAQLQEKIDAMSEQLQVFKTSGLDDMLDLQRALAMVKQQKKQAGAHTPDFITPIYVGGEIDLEATNAALVRDLMKARQLLDLQQDINREQKRTREEQMRDMEVLRADYEEQLAVYARQIDAKNERIRKLEEQLEAFLYHVPGRAPKKLEPAQDLAAQLKLRDDQNLFEMHIERAELSANYFEPSAQTFATFAFYDFETMMTPVLRSLRPFFNYTAQYVVTPDDTFFSYLHTTRVIVEIHRALGMDYETVGVAVLSLDPILRDQKGEMLPHVAQIMRVDDQDATVVGSLHYGLRMLRPVTEALALHQKRQQMLEVLDPSNLVIQASNRRGQKMDALARQNTLYIKITRAMRLRPKDAQRGCRVCAYYQLYNWPRHTTATATGHGSEEVGGAFEATWGDEQSFPVGVTPDMDRYLHTRELTVVVVDLNNPKADELLGLVVVPLAPLAGREQRVAGVYPLLNESNVAVGEIEIELRWDKPYVAPAAEVAKNATRRARDVIDPSELEPHPPPTGPPASLHPPARAARDDDDDEPIDMNDDNGAFADQPLDASLAAGRRPPRGPAPGGRVEMQDVLTMQITSLQLNERARHLFKGAPLIYYGYISDQGSVQARSVQGLKFTFEHQHVFDVKRGSGRRKMFSADVTDEALWGTSQQAQGALELLLLDSGLPEGENEVGNATIAFSEILEGGDFHGEPLEVFGDDGELGRLTVDFYAVAAIRAVRAELGLNDPV